MEFLSLLLIAGVITYLWFRSRRETDSDSGRVEVSASDDTNTPTGEAISHYDESGEPVWKSVPELVEDTPVVEEPLPLPYVHYPFRYRGVYLGFSETPNAEVFLCECAKSAVQVYSRFGFSDGVDPYATVSERDDPAEKVESLREVFPGRLALQIVEGLEAGTDPIDVLSFRSDLCHKCNAAIPIPTHGGTQNRTEFRERFGWYFRQKKHEYGVEAQGVAYLFNPEIGYPDARPKKLNQFVEEAPDSPVRDSEVARRTRNWIENQVREEFGVRAVGESWLAETILHRIVDQLFPDEGVQHHAYPDWLDGQELDVYVPNLDLAFEYQGIQHYEAVEYFGGEEGLEEVQKRDQRKRKLCEQAGVELLEIPYSLELTPPTVARQVAEQQPGLRSAMRAGDEVEASSVYQEEVGELLDRRAPEDIARNG